jgi:predicted transcriptional regulator
MTVALTADIETRLRAYAEDLDLDPEQLCVALLTHAFEDAEAELKDTMDGLDRSAEDFAAGRWLTSEEFDRRMEAVVAAARARRNGSQSEETQPVRKTKRGQTALAR